jgi:hypothetical protein
MAIHHTLPEEQIRIQPTAGAVGNDAAGPCTMSRASTNSAALRWEFHVASASSMIVVPGHLDVSWRAGP